MSTGVGMSSCCLSGKVKEGKPAGTEEEIGGLPCYVAAPENGSKSRSIIFITDVFGWRFANVRLLADDYAKEGFYAYVPDVQSNDSLPIEFLQDVEPPLHVRKEQTVAQKTAATAKVGATLGPWLLKHRESVSKPIIDGFINNVRHTAGTDHVGIIGFCWGGRYAILATHEASVAKGVDAAYACHPSLVAIPGDFDPIARPLSLALGTEDSLLGEKERVQIQELLAKKTDVPHEVRLYEGQVHGFALRGDWSDEKDRKAMDEAEQQGIEWFKKYLGSEGERGLPQKAKD